MILREDQLEALQESQRRHFEDLMVLHLEKHFAYPCAALGEVRVRRAVRRGAERAARHGWTTGTQICKFLNLQFTFGHDFDESLPWVGELLESLAAEGPQRRMERLYQEALERAEEGTGYGVPPEDPA